MSRSHSVGAGGLSAAVVAVVLTAEAVVPAAGQLALATVGAVRKLMATASLAAPVLRGIKAYVLAERQGGVWTWRARQERDRQRLCSLPT